MTKRIWIAMPGNEQMASVLAALTGGEVAELETRCFPDEETYLRLRTDVTGRPVAIVCTLDRPDGKFLPLAFTAAMARDLGATRVGLVAPYLAYMRQDRRFKDGEAITSAYFARLISTSFDWLATIDPHLHRHASLDEIYAIPSRIAHADGPLATWIRNNVERPLIVGPDSESNQWVDRIAAEARCPHVVLDKLRLGDRDVRISLPDMSAWQDRKPVLVDDIISSAATMIEAARLLVAAGMPMPKPICIGIHGLFAGDSFSALSGVAERVVTTNSVPHASNEIDLSHQIAAIVADIAGA
jgi:ribose-phosphate pyrophosphokinase